MRYANVTILAEDERSANFLRRYVDRTVKVGRFRPRISPSGGGDAKQWVLREYPKEVKELRRAHSRNCVVVHVDADVDQVVRRQQQLADALLHDGQEPRKDGDCLSHVIPRRHTETWLCVLTGIAADEDHDCKRHRLLGNPDAAIRPAVLALYQLTRPNAMNQTLPSLVAAIPELQRIER